MQKCYDPIKALAHNLDRLMKAERNQYRSAQSLGKRAGVGHGTVHRMRKGQGAATIDSIQAVAKVFGLCAWQLLVPDLDIDSPPVLRHISKHESDLYLKLRTLAKQISDTEQ